MESTGLYLYFLGQIYIYTSHKYLLSKFNVFGATTYLLDPKLHKSDIYIHKNGSQEVVGQNLWDSDKYIQPRIH